MGLFDEFPDPPEERLIQGNSRKRRVGGRGGLFAEFPDAPEVRKSDVHKGLFADFPDPPKGRPSDHRGMFTDLPDLPKDESGVKKAGFFEAAIRDPLKKLPFSGAGLAETGALVTASMRIKENDYDATIERMSTGKILDQPFAYKMPPRGEKHTAESLKAADIKLLTDYFGKLTKREKQGYTLMGRVGQITSNMPAYMIEFLATGGIKILGSKGAQWAGTQILKESTKRGLGKAVVNVAKFSAGTGTRAFAGMPHRAGETILNRTLPKGITIDDLGDPKLIESGEDTWTSIWKGSLDHYIEIASEQAGEFMGPAIHKVIGKTPMLGKAVGAMQRAWLKKFPTKSATDFVKKIGTKAGFNGVLGEIGEEDLGWMARALFDIEDFGAGPDATIGERFKAGAVQDVQNLPAEFISFAIPGLAGKGIARLLPPQPQMASTMSEDANIKLDSAAMVVKTAMESVDTEAPMEEQREQFVEAAEQAFTVERKISRFPGKIAGKNSLARIGGAIAKDLGVDIEGAEWIYETREGPQPTASIVMNRATGKVQSITLRVGKGKGEVAQPEKVGTAKFAGMKPSRFVTSTQSDIKRTLVHEFGHVAERPIELEGEDIGHHAAFAKWVDENIPKLLGTAEVEEGKPRSTAVEPMEAAAGVAQEQAVGEEATPVTEAAMGAMRVGKAEADYSGLDRAKRIVVSTEEGRDAMTVEDAIDRLDELAIEGRMELDADETALLEAEVRAIREALDALITIEARTARKSVEKIAEPVTEHPLGKDLSHKQMAEMNTRKYGKTIHNPALARKREIELEQRKLREASDVYLETTLYKQLDVESRQLSMITGDIKAPKDAQARHELMIPSTTKAQMAAMRTKGKTTMHGAWTTFTRANKAKATDKRGGGANLSNKQMADIWERTVWDVVGKVDPKTITKKQWYLVQEKCVAQVTLSKPTQATTEAQMAEMELGGEGKKLALTDKAFYEAYQRYAILTMEAEKEGQELWRGSGNWEEYSRKHGYTESEIDDYRYWLKLNEDPRAEAARRGETAEEQPGLKTPKKELTAEHEQTLEELAQALDKRKTKTETPIEELNRRGIYKIIHGMKSLGSNIYQNFMRVERMLEGLDGHKEGTFYNKIWRPLKQADEFAVEATNAGMEEFTSYLENKGIDVTLWLGKVDEIGPNKKPLTASQRIGVYTLSQNKNGMRHLKKGMNLTDEDLKAVIEFMSVEEKTVADWLLDQYEAQWPTLKVAAIAAGIKPGRLKKEYKYSPLLRTDADLEQQDDFLSGLANEYTRDSYESMPESTMLIEREKQAIGKIELDAFVMYMHNIARTERFKAMAPVTAKIGKIINDRGFKRQLNAATYGHGSKILSTWLKDTVRGASTASNTMFQKGVAIARRNGVVYAIGFNLPSSARQTLSMSNAVAVDPLMFKYAPVNITKAMTPKGYTAIEQFVYNRSSLVKTRSFERDLRQKWDKKTLGKKLRHKAPWSRTATSWIKWMDKHTTVVAWKSLYDVGMEKFDGNETKAEQYADKWITRTQPMANAKDLPHFFRGGTIEKLLSTFQNQINNNGNFYVHDIIGARRASKISRTMVGYRVMFSYILPAMLFGIIGRARLPKTWKDVMVDLSTYPIAPLMLVGRWITRMIRGWGQSGTIAEMGPEELIKTVEAIKQGDLKGFMFHAAKTVGAFTGTITAQMVRTTEGALDMLAGSTKDPRRLVYSKWALEQAGSKKRRRGGSWKRRSRGANRARRRKFEGRKRGR